MANKFTKHIEKAKANGKPYVTIRRDVVKRLIQKDEFHKLVCDYSYSDDYYYDAQTNYGKGEVKDASRIIDQLERGARCYIDIKEPNRVHISPYQNLSYSLFLEAPEETEEETEREPLGEHEDSHSCESAQEHEALCDDKDVIDFTARLAEKKEREQLERLKESFFRMFGDEPRHVLRDIAQSIADQDEEKYKELTEPIIMKKAIKHFNKGGF